MWEIILFISFAHLCSPEGVKGGISENIGTGSGGTGSVE
jgi:hypothetical protein